MLYSVTLANKESFLSKRTNEEMIDLLGDTFEVPKQYMGDIVKVDPGYDARLDLIADVVYGDDMYADLLMHLNGPSDPLSISENDYLIFPMMGSLDEFNRQPKAIWSEKTRSMRALMPKVKTKTTKRKPNEAILGDKRFNIDPQSKVIIY